MRVNVADSNASQSPPVSLAPLIAPLSRLSNGEKDSLSCQAQIQSRLRVGLFIIDFHLCVKEPRCHLLADCTF